MKRLIMLLMIYTLVSIAGHNGSKQYTKIVSDTADDSQKTNSNLPAIEITVALYKHNERFPVSQENDVYSSDNEGFFRSNTLHCRTTQSTPIIVASENRVTIGKIQPNPDTGNVNIECTVKIGQGASTHTTTQPIMVLLEDSNDEKFQFEDATFKDFYLKASALIKK